MTGNVLTAVVVLMTGGVLAAPTPQPVAMGSQAKEILDKIAVPKGVCVVLGLPRADQPSFVTDLAAGSEFLVYFQSPSGAEELAVRKAARAAGLLGKRVFADRGSWRSLSDAGADNVSFCGAIGLFRGAYRRETLSASQRVARAGRRPSNRLQKDFSRVGL
ncbi:hypothetical protein ACFL5Q_03495 [Planctomycetota bacterium]